MPGRKKGGGDNPGTVPFSVHERTGVLTGNCKSCRRINIGDIEGRASDEAGKNRADIHAQAGSNRNQQSGCSALAKEKCGHTEECDSEEGRILLQ